MTASEPQTPASVITHRAIEGVPAPLAPSLQRLAVVCPSWVGDTVMATPVLRALRHALPQARITAICRPGLDQILAGASFIDAAIVCENKGLFGPQRLAKAIKQSAAQAVILLPNSFKSAMAARLAGTPIRIGYDRDGRHALLTHRLVPPPHGRNDATVPMIDYYAALAHFALGTPVLDHRLELSTTEDEHRAADSLLEGVAMPFVVLNPGANRADKRWPAAQFARVADRLSQQNLSVVITGAPAEADVLAEVERAVTRPVINIGSRGVTLGSLKAVLARAALLITNDTGPRHIAAAFNTPVVSLFGPTDHRWTTLHYDRERILLAEPFLPEELSADHHAKACAIGKIAVGDVLHAVKELRATGMPR